MVAVAQPFDLAASCKALGPIDETHGQFWVANPWMFGGSGHNLSCYERNRVYANLGDGRFVDVSWLTGADDDADSRGVAAGDLDGDGMPELVTRQVGGGPLKIYRNRYPPASWLRVRLAGRDGNAMGLGARLVATAGGRTVHRSLWAANTFWAQNPHEVLFGLGDATKVDALTILWPSGATQTLKDLPVNRFLEVEEGNPVPRDVTPARPPPPSNDAGR